MGKLAIEVGYRSWDIGVIYVGAYSCRNGEIRVMQGCIGILRVVWDLGRGPVFFLAGIRHVEA